MISIEWNEYLKIFLNFCIFYFILLIIFLNCLYLTIISSKTLKWILWLFSFSNAFYPGSEWIKHILKWTLCAFVLHSKRFASRLFFTFTSLVVKVSFVALNFSFLLLGFYYYFFQHFPFYCVFNSLFCCWWCCSHPNTINSCLVNFVLFMKIIALSFVPT